MLEISYEHETFAPQQIKYSIVLIYISSEWSTFEDIKSIIMKKNTLAKGVIILLVILMLNHFTQASSNVFDPSQGTNITYFLY